MTKEEWKWERMKLVIEDIAREKVRQWVRAAATIGLLLGLLMPTSPLLPLFEQLPVLFPVVYFSVAIVGLFAQIESLWELRLQRSIKDKVRPKEIARLHEDPGARFPERLETMRSLCELIPALLIFSIGLLGIVYLCEIGVPRQ